MPGWRRCRRSVKLTGAIESTFSRYRVIRKLGSGGMGDVYLAEDTTLNRRVALKLLPASHTQDEDRVRRFKQEANAASSLNHPNIVTVHEAGQSQGQHFIAAEFVDGRTLREILRQRGRLSVADALAIAAQVASALAAAHDAGIVHRDVKPENVMVRGDGYVKVLDFGIAKLVTQQSPNEWHTTAAPTLHTQAGVVFGTFQYMSPQQARGLPVDGRNDIWSLGCLIYEMLSGVSPFARETTTDTMVAILEKEPIPLRQLAPEAPAEIEWIVTKALRKNPLERYQSGHELAADVRRLQTGLDVASHLQNVGAPVSSRTLRRSPRALIVAALLISAAIAGAWYWRGRGETLSSPIRTLAILPLKSWRILKREK